MFSAWIVKQRVLWLALVLIISVGVDQATKLWAYNTLRPNVPVIEGSTSQLPRPSLRPHLVVIPGALDLVYAENPAAAFSMTSSIPESFRRPFLLGVTLVAIVAIGAWYMLMRERDALLLTAFALIISGALGNLIDRARLGYVIDFLDVYVSHPGVARWLIEHVSNNHWPTFNVADSAIVGGVLLVVFRTMRPSPRADA